MLCIVDPDIADREAVREFVTRIGYEVVEFSTAENLLASDKLRSGITGVVAELDLPGMNGIELAQALRQSGFDVPVIILTGSTDVASAVRAHKNKVDAYIPKPFVERRLATCLADLVGQAH